MKRFILENIPNFLPPKKHLTPILILVIYMTILSTLKISQRQQQIKDLFQTYLYRKQTTKILNDINLLQLEQEKQLQNASQD